MDRQRPTMMDVPQPPQPEAPTTFVCGICQFDAKTTVGLSRHVHSKHGYAGLAVSLNPQPNQKR